MDANKLDLSAKPAGDLPATYKTIAETDMEEEAALRSKILPKPKIGSVEADGADEKMLEGEDEKIEFKDLNSEKQNGDAKLDIAELKSEFVGLTKEELMKYANDPFWVRLRWFLFITFWLLWASMLVGAVMIIYAAPKCDPPPPKTWWEQGPLTEIESPSSVTTEELISLQNNGIQGFILSWAGDVYAPLEQQIDLVDLIKNGSQANLNFIIDLQPGTSSRWFTQSEMSESPFEDYYIWQRGKSDDDTPPNNWKMVDSNASSWKYSPQRRQFYYAPHGMPQLNLRHANVTSELSKVMGDLLKLGAKGVRLRGVPWLLADSALMDERPAANKQGVVHTDYDFYTHTKTENLPELGELLGNWRKIVKNYTENGPFMSNEPLTNLESYKINSTLVLDLPLESQLFTNQHLDAPAIIRGLDKIFNVSNITWPLWKYKKFDSNDALEIVTFALPGAPLVESNSTIRADTLKQRTLPSIMRGNFTYHLVANDTVVSFIRVTAGTPGVLIAYNPTNETITVDFLKDIPAISDEVTVSFFSNNYSEPDVITGGKQDAHKIPISKKSAIVLSYVPKSS